MTKTLLNPRISHQNTAIIGQSKPLLVKKKGGAGMLAGAWLLILLIWNTGFAAPYPPEGELVHWSQPDGEQIALRVFGDEFYARTATEAGYTVVFESADNAYYYASVGPDGQNLVSSGVKVGAKAGEVPSGIARNLQEPKETVALIRSENIRKYASERAAKWSARVQAVQMQRSAGPAGAPLPSSQELAEGAPMTGSKVGLMVLAQFPDDPATVASDPVLFPVDQTKMGRLCNQAGYNDDGNSGSIRDYYFDQSNGQLTFTHSVSAVVTLPHAWSYYNWSDYPANKTLRDNGEAGRLLVADSIAQLQASNFDFSTLTVDSRQNVYATSVLFAGRNSGVWARGLWPHAWAVSPINVGSAGSPRYISSYECTNVETTAPVIGTMVHELGHLLMSYPDFYDYGQDSEGVGEHCLMGSGNYLNGGKTPSPIDLYLKDFSGWATISDLAPGQTLDKLMPTTGNIGVRIRKPGVTTEYFLFENRGSGDKWADYSRDKGIAIWHVDETVSGNDNQQMTASQHYELSLEQSDARFDLEAGKNRGDSTDLFDYLTPYFNNSTLPDSKWWSGLNSDVSATIFGVSSASMRVLFGPTGVINLNASPQEGGTVAGSGTFSAGSSQVIRAKATEGWAFTGWSDGNKENPRTIVVPVGGATYTANFTQSAQITVIADPSNGGTVTGSGTYLVGSSQVITATAAPGWMFAGWSDGVKDSNRTITVTWSGATYIARFLQTAVISMQTDPVLGGVVFGSGTYAVGSLRVIRAEALPGWLFAGWADGYSQNPRPVIVPQGGATYTAQFVPSSVLSLQCEPAGAGRPMGSGTFVLGEMRQISAEAAAGWLFTGWQDGSTSNPRAITLVESAMAFRAMFAPAGVLSLQSSPARAGSIAGSGTFLVGVQREISANAARGWKFTSWADGETQNPRTVTVTAGVAEYVANFSPCAQLRAIASPSIGGTVLGSGTFVVGTRQEISAVANPGWKFMGWNDLNWQAIRSVPIPNADVEYVAKFTPEIEKWAGSYYGVFHQNATGSEQIKVTAQGAYSGSLKIDGHSYSFVGAFSRQGTSEVIIPKTACLCSMRFGSKEGELVVVLTSGTNPLAAMELTRSMVDAKGNIAAIQGKYTALLRASGTASISPAGSGFAALNMDNRGSVRASGKLADGSIFAYAAPVNQDSAWPIYLPLYTNGAPIGFVVGSASFEDKLNTDLEGSLLWLKPGRLGDKIYPNGFEAELGFVGSKFIASGSLASSFLNSTGSLGDGSEPSLFEGTFSLLLSNVIKIPANSSGVSLSLKLNQGTGLFTGEILGLSIKADGKPAGIPVQGAMLQKSQSGGGYYLDHNTGCEIIISRPER